LFFASPLYADNQRHQNISPTRTEGATEALKDVTHLYEVGNASVGLREHVAARCAGHRRVVGFVVIPVARLGDGDFLAPDRELQQPASPGPDHLEYSSTRMEYAMEALKDATHLYEVERRAQHAARPGFRIQEIQISKTQKVPWHYHNNIQDTFYVLQGNLRLFLREPKEEVRLGPGETYSVKPRRPHLVTNAGESSATFLLLQGIGEYDYVPLV
jgi:quercetin dioxygenase-like cupin family protein